MEEFGGFPVYDTDPSLLLTLIFVSFGFISTAEVCMGKFYLLFLAEPAEFR